MDDIGGVVRLRSLTTHTTRRTNEHALRRNVRGLTGRTMVRCRRRRGAKLQGGRGRIVHS